MVDRAELRKLATRITDQGVAWYPPGILFDLLGSAVLDTEQCEMDAAYIAAASPAVVMGLLDEIEALAPTGLRKLDADTIRALMDENDRLRSVYMAERDQHVAHNRAMISQREAERETLMKIAEEFKAERDQLRAVAVRLKGYLENIQGNTRQDVVRWDCETALADPEVEKL